MAPFSMIGLETPREQATVRSGDRFFRNQQSNALLI